jgi:hypothetical protein
MHRPLGLTIIAALNLLRGLLGFLLGVPMLLFRFLGTTFDIAVMLSSLVLVSLGIGLWRKRSWARRASIILILGGFLAQITVAVFIPSLYDFSWRQTSLTLAENAIDIWVVIYLLRSRVRRLFLSPSTGAML